ncbi:riboflavin synthase eubacterial/eukaryotic [Klebsiella pneumoniae]|uniref:Riboflavin synthase n=4 Tax=Enterobacteriaceae TaxID=543 RepID=A0A447S8E0_KLEPN|nr:riboflavin synthase eubacterial/eukaryotic [Klebsiella pneumoniae]
MFTGIVQGTAKVVSIDDKPNFRTHVVELPAHMLEGLETGASVANNGCCLTVTEINGARISFDLMKETLRITNLGDIQVGDEVNVERAAKFSDEIGGHLMSGHIMTTAEIVKILTSENNRQIWFKVQDPTLMKYILYKGFIGIDGISLTVGEVTATRFCVHLIPETLQRTTLGAKKLGDRVNIEIDPQTQAVVDTVERVLPRKRWRLRSMKPEKKSPADKRGVLFNGDAQSMFNTAREHHLPELNVAARKAPAQAFR